LARIETGSKQIQYSRLERENIRSESKWFGARKGSSLEAVKNVDTQSNTSGPKAGE